MVSTTTDPQCDEAVPFRESHWRTRWLFVGLAVILLWRSSAFLDRDWLSQLPWWIWIIVAGLVPQAFLLTFPIMTRSPRGRLPIPTLKRCLIEFGIAIPVVIASMAFYAALEFLLSRFWPGASFSDVDKRMAESSWPLLTYLMLLFSFTFAPVAEETFFRGFLQNAFGARMPWMLATVIQSLIFGFCHFFGAMHSAGAFLAGLVLTLVYEWRRTLIAPILVHAGCNAVSAVGVAVMMVAYANSPVLGVGGDPNDATCVVRQIVPDSAAEKAGLQVGDVVIAFNRQPVRDLPHLAETVRRYQPGDTIPVSINRADSLLEIIVVLQRRRGT